MVPSVVMLPVAVGSGVVVMVALEKGSVCVCAFVDRPLCLYMIIVLCLYMCLYEIRHLCLYMIGHSMIWLYNSRGTICIDAVQFKCFVFYIIVVVLML